ncbi:MAG TPA: hypothetical protein VGI43_00055 [Mucilaginibacter sp.]|jgi:hypothetical protein
MTVITIKIPDGKAKDVSSFVKEMGGEVITNKKVDGNDDDDVVTHGVFFGENIKRVLRAFKKS